MGQQEIIDVLEKEKIPMAGREIAELVGQSWQGKVSILLKKLLDNNEIKCIQLDRQQAYKYFKSKRVLRLYYISSFNKRDFSKTNPTSTNK